MSAHRPKEGAKTDREVVTGGLSPWRTDAPWCAATRLVAAVLGVKMRLLMTWSSTGRKMMLARAVCSRQV